MWNVRRNSMELCGRQIKPNSKKNVKWISKMHAVIAKKSLRRGSRARQKTCSSSDNLHAVKTCKWFYLVFRFFYFSFDCLAFQGIWIIVRDNLSALKNVSSHNEKMDESVNKVTGSRKNSLIESTLQNSKANKKASWRLHKSMRRTWKVLLHVVKDAQYCSSLFLVVECMVVFAVVFAAACS